MSHQYSFSSNETPPEPQPVGAALAIDTGSPVVSVALSLAGRVVAERATELRESSSQLLRMIDEVLEVAGLRLADLDMLLGLRGPGSFTGLRVGLATLQGIRMALGIETATLPTLQVLATLVSPGDLQGTACVDALQGRWLTQDFGSTPPFLPIDEPTTTATEDLAARASGTLVGFGISDLRDHLQPGSSVVLIEPGPLAPQALRVLHLCPPDRDPKLLASPLYLRAPAVTPARHRAN